MIKRIDEGNNVSGNLPPSVDEFLQDIAQMYGGISYTDIMGHNYSDEDIRKLKNLRRRSVAYSDEMDEEEYEDYMNTKIVPSVKKIFNKEVKESKTLTEDTSADWSVKQLTMDVAIKGKDAEVYGLNSPAHGGSGKLYNAMSKFLHSQGMEMMSDYIDASVDLTDVYESNIDGSPFTESIHLNESTPSSKFSNSINKIISELNNLEVPLDEGTENEVYEGFAKVKKLLVKCIVDHADVLETMNYRSQSSQEVDDLVDNLMGLVK